MYEHEYQQMYDVESFYWWFIARRKLIREVVSTHSKDPAHTTILDVGCGTGLNHEMLSEFGEVFGTDASEEALRFSRQRNIQNLVLSDAEALQFADETFEIVTALDVLEHVNDDLKAISEIWRVMKPDGVFVISVPAYGFLWSEHDEALHHRRRYAAHELRNKLINAGFEVERSTYFISSLFFPILFMRIVQNLRKKSLRPSTSHVILPKWLNSFLVGILDFERWFLRFANLPFGVSIICTARKPTAERVAALRDVAMQAKS
ncbi:Methyltransferase type 11 [Candidatus Koribacter versatilis Ellin345]|uniref:Methyltransferase type 11 n=1 Tax=Koribacter versatilis (strain Ellin345) TaxID=204669 RepID=Q1ILX2_KORVE|nr:class I SAM-dependent methyltransferase [Candidatus Koribacter versatilis]ABF42128.1 Methyltransferase type 11 [Candidatus Koribacter versatilis Ellin345]